jgi:hypothetical protein
LPFGIFIAVFVYFSILVCFTRETFDDVTEILEQRNVFKLYLNVWTIVI